jgi:hypothetical protein
VLQLFYVTLDKSGADKDEIYIAGETLPALPNGYEKDGRDLIIIDIGQPGATTANGQLPTFYIPHQGLGDYSDTDGYAHIRLRVNSGASAVILADNTGGASDSCPAGYFNNGCIEVMKGGKLRDGAYMGFPLGADGVILNRTGSFLAVGPETEFTENETYSWWNGWLIGPKGGTDDSADDYVTTMPRIVWDDGNEEYKYIEVRPTDLAIDANVTVKKNVGLIYSVWFVDGSQVTVDVIENPVQTFGAAKGLKVNDTDDENYEFYGNPGKNTKIIVKPGNSIDIRALESDNNGDDMDWYTNDEGPEKDVEIVPVNSGDPKSYANDTASGISGYNAWTGYTPGN